MSTNPKLYEAFEEEGKDIRLEDLMAEMMASFNQEKGYTSTVVDELRIRKMMLARKYIEKEMERLAFLKEAIMQEWNERINKKKQDIDSINEFIERWIKETNNEQKLSLDVGTVTLRRSAPKVVVKADQIEAAKTFLREHNQLESYLKPAPLDTTLLQNAYINQFDQLVEKTAQERIQKEIETNGKGKITKKREGEIKLEVENELADGYYTQLPDFFEYVPETKKLSITMK